MKKGKEHENTILEAKAKMPAIAISSAKDLSPVQLKEGYDHSYV